VSVDLRALRILIAHDWIVTWGGAERCLEQILEVVPHADVAVAVLAPHLRSLNGVTRRARETWLGKLPGARSHHRWLLPLEGLAFSLLDTANYDLIISSSHAFAKMVRPKSRAAHVCYCYTPPRYLWDLRDVYKSDARGLEKVALTVGTGWLRTWDAASAQRVDHFVAISNHVARRITNWYGRASEVLYPPVSAKPVAATEQERASFVLYLGRLVPYKRLDLAISACELLGVRLVIAGDGPDRRRLEQLAGRNTTLLGSVSEADAGHLLSTCGTFIYCGEEDFGIAPLEANAHGAPVVYLRRGGVAETMEPGITGMPFDDATPEAVADAVKAALAVNWPRETLRLNADRFSPPRFREGFRSILDRVLAGR